RIQPTLGGLPLSPPDRLLEKVDPGDRMAALREVKRRIAGAAAGVEHGADDLVDHSSKRRLRPADVPRGDAGVGFFKHATIRNLAHEAISYVERSGSVTAFYRPEPSLPSPSSRLLSVV